MILMSSVANVADGGVDDCCCWMEVNRTRASAAGESSVDAVLTGGGGVESGLLLVPLPPLPLAAMPGCLVASVGLMRTGEERVGDRARVAAAAGAWPMKIWRGVRASDESTEGKERKNKNGDNSTLARRGKKTLSESN